MAQPSPTPQRPPPSRLERLRRWIVTGSVGTLKREMTSSRSIGRNILLAAAVGMVAGIGAVVFHMMTGLVAALALQLAAGYDPGAPAGESGFIDQQWFAHHARSFVPWMLVLVPTLGGLVSGWLVYTFAPEAEGHGTDAVIEAYHMKRGEIRSRVPIVKMLASAITLGTGGSGGREGPIAQIGAGFGSYLAAKLKLSVSERRLLTVTGLGAGIAAIFHAPLAGAMFAIEVLYRDPDFEAEALIPSFIACTVAYCVFSLILGLTLGLNAFHPLFVVTAEIHFENPALLGPLAILAGAMALASWGYVRCFYGTNRLFHRLKMPPVLKPALGAMLTGVVALVGFYALRQVVHADPANPTGFVDPAMDALGVLASGYGFLQKVLALGSASEARAAGLVGLLLVVGLGKILTTSLTIGSGGSGGVFGPLMVIGGSLGAVVGIALNRVMPDIVADADVIVFAILGMASFFAAAANTPVSTLIMVSELTGSYALLMPAMWVCALAYVVSRGWTIYAEQVKNRLESPAHRGDFIIDILEGMTVRDAMTESSRRFVTVPIDMPLGEVVRMLTGNRQAAFPVLDQSMRYYGLFSLNDVRQFLYDTDVNIGNLAVAQDLATEVPPLLTNTELGEAMGRFAQSAYEELPVAEGEDSGEVIGMIRRADVIAAYNAQLLQSRGDRKQGA